MHTTDSAPEATSMSSINGNGHPEELDAAKSWTQMLVVSTTVLLQAVDLLDNHLTSDDQLTVSSKFLPGSTIGKHLRHARDHFVLLADCVTSPPPHVLSYDTRNRNTPMESSLSAARDALLATIKQLEDVVPRTSMNKPLTLNAVTPYVQTFETTFGRELWFAGLHCVHHWSMVRVIAGELDIHLTDDFGFAPSTLVHQGKFNDASPSFSSNSILFVPLGREGPLGKSKI